jgi:hypothetical protein
MRLPDEGPNCPGHGRGTFFVLPGSFVIWNSSFVIHNHGAVLNPFSEQEAEKRASFSPFEIRLVTSAVTIFGPMRALQLHPFCIGRGCAVRVGTVSAAV